MSDRAEANMIGALYTKYKSALVVQELEKNVAALAQSARQIADKLDADVQQQTNEVKLLQDTKQTITENANQLAHSNAQLDSQFARLQKEYTTKYSSERELYESQISELRARLADLHRRHDELVRFSENKENMEKQLEAYQIELDSDQQAHEQTMNEMEKKNAAEREALNGEMLRRIKETKLTLLAMTQDTLHPTTKRTQQENEQMTTELAYQSRECEKLVQNNRQLRRDNVRITEQIFQKSETERLLATRSHFFQKLIHKLREKIDAGEKAVADYRKHMQSHQNVPHAPLLFASEELIKSLHMRYQEMGTQFQQAQDRVAGLESQLQHHRDMHEVLLTSQDAVTTLLLTCFEDHKVKSGATSIDELSKQDRARILQTVLARLHSFQHSQQIGLFDDLSVSQAPTPQPEHSENTISQPRSPSVPRTASQQSNVEVISFPIPNWSGALPPADRIAEQIKRAQGDLRAWGVKTSAGGKYKRF